MIEETESLGEEGTETIMNMNGEPKEAFRVLGKGK